MSKLTDLPLIHSVAKELEAIAEPQPKVLKRASTIFPPSSTWICQNENRATAEGSMFPRKVVGAQWATYL